MKIFLRPGDVLAALLAGATVTTGRSTTNRADKLRAVIARLLHVFRDDVNGKREDEDENAAEHAREINRARGEDASLMRPVPPAFAQRFGVIADVDLADASRAVAHAVTDRFDGIARFFAKRFEDRPEEWQ